MGLVVKNGSKIFCRVSGDARAVVRYFDPDGFITDPVAQGDGAAFGADGLGGVDDQVHDHLVDLRRQAFHLRQRCVFLDHVGLVFDFIGDDVQRRIHALLQIGHLPFLAGVNAGEVLQVLDDLPDTADAILGFL